MTRDNPIWNYLGLFGLLLGLFVAAVAGSPQDYGLTPVLVRWLALASTLLAATLKFANSQLPGENDARKIDVSKIAPLVLILLLPGLLAGCAPSFKAKLHQADRSVQSALFTLDQTENEAFKAGQVPADFHKRFSGYMVTALTAGQTFHRSVMAYQPGQKIPVDVIQLAGALQSAADLVRSLPASDTRAKIAAVLDAAAFVANQLLVLVLPEQAEALFPSMLVYATEGGL